MNIIFYSLALIRIAINMWPHHRKYQRRETNERTRQRRMSTVMVAMVMMMMMIFTAKSEKKCVCYTPVPSLPKSPPPSLPPLSSNDPSSSSFGVFCYANPGRQKRPFTRFLLFFPHFYSIFLLLSVARLLTNFWIFLYWELIFLYLFSKFTVITSREIRFIFGWLLHIYVLCFVVFSFDVTPLTIVCLDDGGCVGVCVCEFAREIYINAYVCL